MSTRAVSPLQRESVPYHRTTHALASAISKVEKVFVAWSALYLGECARCICRLPLADDALRLITWSCTLQAPQSIENDRVNPHWQNVLGNTAKL